MYVVLALILVLIILVLCYKKEHFISEEETIPPFDQYLKDNKKKTITQDQMLSKYGPVYMAKYNLIVQTFPAKYYGVIDIINTMHIVPCVSRQRYLSKLSRIIEQRDLDSTKVAEIESILFPDNEYVGQQSEECDLLLA